MIWAIGQCIFGLVFLWLASEVLVDYSSHLGKRLRISSFVVGVVIVGFGTSLPELTVSSIAAAQGDLDLSVGNIAGSNAANLSLALGLAALAAKGLDLPASGLKRLSIISAASVGVFALLVQGHFSRYEGIILLALVAPVVWVLYKLQQSNTSILDTETGSSSSIQKTLLFLPISDRQPLWQILFGVFAGLGLTIFGAQVLVWGTGNLAEEISVETGFLGLTLVALGTSAPEIIVGIRSARKNEAGILAGNLLGSNISNSLIVGGVVAVLGPGTVSDSGLTLIAVPIMLGISVLGGIFMTIGKNVNKLEAMVLILVWIAMLPFVV